MHVCTVELPPIVCDKIFEDFNLNNKSNLSKIKKTGPSGQMVGFG